MNISTFTEIIDTLNDGGLLQIITYGRVMEVTKKHVSILKLKKNGNFYIGNNDCSYAKIVLYTVKH